MQLADAVYCAIDLETTGLDFKKDEIVSIAIIPIVNLRILVGDAFYSLIKPRKYRIESMQYHGISGEGLEKAPKFDEIADRILRRIGGIFVGYSVEFDYLVLQRYFKAWGMKLRRELLDIGAIERWLRLKSGSGEPDLSFEGMMERYRLKQYFRHNALADAYFAAQIFQMQVRLAQNQGVDSVEMLAKVVESARPTDHGVAF
jgi:DNA polymerase-3 subunit epsilon